jgi:hypothetical protein
MEGEGEKGVEAPPGDVSGGIGSITDLGDLGGTSGGTMPMA